MPTQSEITEIKKNISDRIDSLEETADEIIELENQIETAWANYEELKEQQSARYALAEEERKRIWVQCRKIDPDSVAFQMRGRLITPDMEGRANVKKATSLD